jgi:hypothetical protein
MNRTASIYFGPPGQESYFVCSAPAPDLSNLLWRVSRASIDGSTVSTSLRDESIKRIDELQSLKDDWDGYGGYAPSKLVCSHANRLINCLAREFPELPSPEISPTSNGTVLLTWGGGLGEATLEVGDFQFSGYIRRSDSVVPLSGEATVLGESQLSIIAGCLV